MQKLIEEERAQNEVALKFKNELDTLWKWYKESYDAITAEVYVTFDKGILRELLDQSKV